MLSALNQAVEQVDGAVVERVGLAGPNHLNGPLQVGRQLYEAVEVLEDEVGALVPGKAPRPHDGQHIGVHDVTGLVGHHLEQLLLQLALAGQQGIVVFALEGGGQLRVAPVLAVLRVGDGDDFADAVVAAPHVAAHHAVHLAHGVGLTRKAQSRERVVQRVAVANLSHFAHLRLGHAAEEAHVGQQAERALLVAGQLRRVGGEYQALLHLGQAAAVLFVEVKRQWQAVALVEVVHVGFAVQQVEQLAAAHAQHDALGHAGRIVGVVEVVRDGARYVVILRDVRGQEEHRHRAEHLRCQVHSLHKHLGPVDGDGEGQPRVLQVGVGFAAVLGAHGLVLGAGLVVVAEAPQHPDSHQVLLQLIS